jgi:hypothetical protein
MSAGKSDGTKCLATWPSAPHALRRGYSCLCQLPHGHEGKHFCDHGYTWHDRKTCPHHFMLATDRSKMICVHNCGAIKPRRRAKGQAGRR